MASELTKRVAVAAVGIPLALVVLYYGGIPLGILLAIIAAGAVWELYRMAAQKGVRAFVIPGMIIAATFVMIATAVPNPAVASQRFWLVLMVSLLVLSAAAIWRRGVDGGPLTAVAVTLLGALLTGGTLAYAVFLRGYTPPNVLDVTNITHPVSPLFNASPWLGSALVGFPLILTWISDTFAYFGGRMWGNRKLIPSVSPGKTVAGAVSGVVGTTIIGALYGAFIFQQWLDVPITLIEGAIGGAVVSVVAQTGDLAESLLKREAGVKDSGALLPGHGGVFDRFDSLLFAFPVAYWYLSYVLRVG